MKTLFLSFILFLVATPVWSLDREAVVIEVIKKVKLHQTERVYSDYFIRGGTKLGLSQGILVSVVRRVPVHDPFENSSVGDFKIKVADIEIIQVDEDKSIGRLIEIDRREARPMLAYDAVMIGDRLDLDTMRAKVAYKEIPENVFEKFENPTRLPSAQTQPEDALLEELKNIEPVLTNPPQ